MEHRTKVKTKYIAIIGTHIVSNISHYFIIKAVGSAVLLLHPEFFEQCRSPVQSNPPRSSSTLTYSILFLQTINVERYCANKRD